jgi:predicted MPP superfamily phosphohydrolase
MLTAEYLAASPRRRWVTRTVLITLLVLAATTAYAYLIEPNRLQVTRHRMTGPVREPLKIAHITDLHTQGFGPREQTLVHLVRQQAPDIIVITGDTVDKGQLAPARDLLASLSAPLGVWIVRGNWERWTLQEDEKEFYARLGMRFMVNAGQAAREDVWVAGLDDPASGEPDLNKALTGAPTHAFKLVLLHAPDYFDQIAGRFDLALAGHTHGGQLVIPGLAPFWLPPGGKRYVRGWYSRNASQLFVSRGIGTSIIPARLFARPELAIIEVTPR